MHEIGVSIGEGGIQRRKTPGRTKPTFSASGRAAGMRSQTVVVSVALLALCCLLIPGPGESAGGIVSLQQNELEEQAGDLLRDEFLEDPESEKEPAAVARSRPGRSAEVRTDTVEAGEWRHVLS